MVQTVKSLWNTTPDVTPLASGLLDHVQVVEDIAWQRPTGLGLSYNCLDTAVPTELCPEPTTAKEFSNPSVIEGIEFAVYGGLVCKPFGFDVDTGKSEIERVFRLKESRGVERALMETRFVAGPTGPDGPLWDAAVDLTPDLFSPSAREGLAILEGYAASVYAGVPTIHAPYTVGSLLASQEAIEPQAGRFYSRLGSKVAVGAGYEYPNSSPGGGPTDDAERWMYVTGEVMVARSELISQTHLDTDTNDIVALAERRYIAAIDCFTAAVRVGIRGAS